jgi:hypothetical protein
MGDVGFTAREVMTPLLHGQSKMRTARTPDGQPDLQGY